MWFAKQLFGSALTSVPCAPGRLDDVSMLACPKYVRNASIRMPLPRASAGVGRLKVTGPREAYTTRLHASSSPARPAPAQRC